MTKFNIGEKVIPLSKSYMGGLENSVEWRKAQEQGQDYLFVNSIADNGTVICYHKDVTNKTGDYFKESDLVSYTEKEITNKSQELINKLKPLVEEANAILEALTKTQQVKPVPTVSHVNARQQIINEAKDFVEEYRAVQYGDSSHDIGNGTAQYHYYETVFATKDNKVTAIVYRLDNGEVRQKKPAHIGRAKCDPDDVFNQHIGEAIALGRALDINVDKFINAVKPTEFVLGQVVSGATKENPNYIHDKQPCYGAKGNKVFNHPNEMGWLHKPYTKILSDTKAIYEVQ